MLTKRNLCIAIGAAFLTYLTAAPVQAHAMSAQQFVTKASVGNRFEIDSSKLALKKSQNDDVKSFAQRMIQDHTAIGDKMSDVLSSSNSGATPATSLDSKHRKLMDKLKSANGNDFDREYIHMQTNGHKEAVSLFNDYSRHGANKPLRDLATQTLPMIKEHLKMAEQLSSNQ